MFTVEIIQKNASTESKDELIKNCQQFLHKYEGISPGKVLSDFNDFDYLTNNVLSIILDEKIKISDIESGCHNLRWVVYRLDGFGPQEDVLQDSDEVLTLSTNWILPSADLHCLWENLIYENEIKQNLLKFAETTLLFSANKIDQNIISSNRMVLLHGPPGTGKTSLCRAFAHKVAARLRDRYTNAQLIEINSHSLFSKWFSESGKLVTKMFAHIRDVSEDVNSLVFVLIDEVESLAHARTQALSGTEPSDSIRVVNAVLTQIDQMCKYNNVFILTTSNMTEAIDLAFVNRADIKQFIALPSAHAIYQVYYTCLQELLRVGIISPRDVILPHTALLLVETHPNTDSAVLLEISHLSVGLSGRTLRKIPFLAQALFLNKNKSSLREFLEAMRLAVLKHIEDTNSIESK
ncbi:pachytene checkpoint protein 2 homolog [Chrysoperla carnea]|uniref:pachytene checkpoint protein 2 homolog n=1 Tax=Chrysoperla carnea TaxID=189513 RepID=UPI001D06B0EA|nr:pachytene checkpoint protein 2 homolog [Chrysoperla carnea]